MNAKEHKKKKKSTAKTIIKLGFSEQDIIDAADYILEQEYNPYIDGVYHVKGSKVVKKVNKAKSKKGRKAS